MSATNPLDGKEILLCVTGGIACTKAAAAASKLRQAGAAVTCAMTAAAQKFVTPLTFQTLTDRPVYGGMWETADRYDPKHVGLIEQAELLIMAPATANSIGKAAGGIADDLVSAAVMTALADRPILLAPAMNTRMWANPIVQANLAKLKEFGVATVGPNEGWLACGTVGAGRMAEPEEIVAAAAAMFTA